MEANPQNSEQNEKVMLREPFKENTSSGITAFLILFGLLGGLVGWYFYDANKKYTVKSTITDQNEAANPIPIQKRLEQKNSSLTSSPFFHKYFYVTTCIYEEFDTFFENPDSPKFTVLYFKDNSNVIYYANINGWQKGVNGKYRYSNGEIIINIPDYIATGTVGERFGGDIKILNDKQIIAYYDGHPKCKFLNFIPE